MGGSQMNYLLYWNASDGFILGEGKLLTICATDSPPAYPVMVNMNFKPHITSGVLASLNWATAEEDYTPRESSCQPGIILI